MPKLLTLIAVVASLTLTAATYGVPIFTGPTPYFSQDDSPWDPNDFAGFWLEDFEGGGPDTPGVASTTGGSPIGSSGFTDSVDGDSPGGLIDNNGTDASSFFSQGVTTIFTFEFEADELGGLPTHAGIVWTDVGFAPVTGFGDVTFQAFGPGGLLGTIGPVTLGDGVATGTTTEDRFFGVEDLNGISSITLAMAVSNDWEADHLQYGIVPEPASAAIFAVGLGMFVRRGTRGAGV